jgi:copper homeostasis protein
LATARGKSSISPISSSRVLLEVIVRSADDARAAAEGGADRLEVVREIRVGGLTPSASLVREVASATPLPLRVMVRENAGYGTDAAELVPMFRAAASFADIGVDGLVAGFARDGQLLLDELREVLHAAPGLSLTFHRAFDSLADPLRAIDTLSEIPQIDRILTDGIGIRPGLGGPALRSIEGLTAVSPGPPPRRCARLREYSDRAGSRLTIIAGSHVDEQMLGEIARTRCVREVHVGRAARENADPEGPVTAARVRRLREIVSGLP